MPSENPDAPASTDSGNGDGNSTGAVHPHHRTARPIRDSAVTRVRAADSRAPSARISE